MNTFLKSLVVGAILVVGSAFAGTNVSVTLARNFNVDNLRDANLTIGSEAAGVRVDMDGFRLSLNGMDPDLASMSLAVKQDVVGFDHVGLTIDKHNVGASLSKDVSIAGGLSFTGSVGASANNLHNLPTVNASLALVYGVW